MSEAARNKSGVNELDGESDVVPAPVTIDLAVEAGSWPDEASLRALTERAVAAADAVALPELEPGAELSVLFTDDAAIRELNARWRNKDRATNVLSFPQGAGPMLGDIVLAAETVAREAGDEAKAIDHHITHLVVHGFLHLLGYDHEDDAEAEEMENLERMALARLGIADPYATSAEHHE